MDVRQGGAGPREVRADPWGDEDGGETPVRPLSRVEAQALLASQRSLSPWQVVAAQALVGVGVAVLAWLLTRQAVVLASALVGAAAVVLPHAVMAWGLRRPAAQASGALLAFFFWEAVKVGLALVILVVAAWAWGELSWLALLVGLVACLKVNLWALWWYSRPERTTS